MYILSRPTAHAQNLICLHLWEGGLGGVAIGACVLHCFFDNMTKNIYIIWFCKSHAILVVLFS